MDVTPDSVKALFESDDYGQRISAVNQMRYLQPAIAFDMLMQASIDSNTRVRYAAVSQISSVGDQNLDQTKTLLRDRLLNDPEPDVRSAAADSIGALQLTDLFEALHQVYTETSEWLLQFSIIATLGELGDPRGFDLLETALESDIELVRTAAVGALGELGDPRAIALLKPLASHEDWQLRYRVVQALNHLGGEEAQAILNELADDSVEQIAREARQG
ncbi:MAG: HEAT repeat domain-containing protein [Elainellaceae cyanobacterium]